MKKLMKLLKNEDGQVLVLAALLMVVLMGFAALVVDVGTLYLTKAKLQNAADAAALAGAKDLPNASTANSTAINYAGQNGVQASETTITIPYNSDSTKVEVVCTRKVSYTFARVLGFTETQVSARAVAKNNNWVGGALPFINLDGYGIKGETLNGWDKVNPGDKERIHNDDLVISPDDTSIKVIWEDGSIMFTEGKNLSEVADALKNILKDGNIVYMFAVSNAKVGNAPYDNLGQKQLIPLADTVLLKCKVIGNYVQNNDLISLQLVQVYNYDTVAQHFLIDDYPPPNLVE